MNANAVVLLQGLLDKSRDQTRNQLSDNDHNTYWAAEQYLKSTGVSPEELIAGIVDGEKDCGLDAVYIFANGICISDDTPLPALGRRTRLELVLMQVKDSKGFGEDAIDKIIVNLPRLLQFDRDENSLLDFANARVVETTRRFLKCYRELELPELQIYVIFSSLKASQVHPNTVGKATELEKVCAGLFGQCPVHAVFLDAPGLYDLARESRVTTRSLQLAENPISTDTAGGYIGVVQLDAYQKFITTKEGELDTSLFEANVRDYEGETIVNKSIEQTLATTDPDVDFWWLNNGVTIVATQVQLANKLLQLEAPQIVNGLQTSTEIYKRSRLALDGDDRRSVLVKIIQANDAAVRERIIRATNSQTSFGPSALRATDKVQRQIEDYLTRHNYYYERRRRHYYNQGKPMERIVSIDGMGQALVSILVQAPHVARATPSRVFEPEIYDLAFHAEYPVQMYAAAIQLLRQCEDFLRSVRVESADDFRFQLAMLVGIAATRKAQPSTKDLASLEDQTISRDLLTELLTEVRGQYDLESRQRGVLLLDQLAKSERVTQALLDRARRRLFATTRDRR
ncbi:AIPR family protein [Blastococcus sp. SYSU DS0617]